MTWRYSFELEHLVAFVVFSRSPRVKCEFSVIKRPLPTLQPSGTLRFVGSQFHSWPHTSMAPRVKAELRSLYVMSNLLLTSATEPPWAPIAMKDQCI
jgi:hypothetical protein